MRKRPFPGAIDFTLESTAYISPRHDIFASSWQRQFQVLTKQDDCTYDDPAKLLCTDGLITASKPSAPRQPGFEPIASITCLAGTRYRIQRQEFSPRVRLVVGKVYGVNMILKGSSPDARLSNEANSLAG